MNRTVFHDGRTPQQLTSHLTDVRYSELLVSTPFSTHNTRPMALSPGTRLGPYEILSAAGAGGMGEVYRSRDTRLDRIVAIKVLPQDLVSNSELKQRFEREARAISQLQHPHICVLYDVGSQNGSGYLVMEYLEGETLADRVRKGPL